MHCDVILNRMLRVFIFQLTPTVLYAQRYRRLETVAFMDAIYILFMYVRMCVYVFFIS